MFRQDLADEVADILGIPREPRQGTSYKVVNAILNTIIGALQRGEKVKVDGFGIFEIYDQPPRRHSACFYHEFKREYQQIARFPAKKRVIFKPSKTIVKALNA